MQIPNASLYCDKTMCATEPSLQNRLLNVRAALLQLQEAVAKHNASFRTRYPQSDPLYKVVERSIFGVFNDIPLQIHAFSYAAEEVACACGEKLPLHPLDMYSEGIADILDISRSWAGQPMRNARGVIQWRKSLSHVEKHLAQEIGSQARIFFDCVYSLPRIKKDRLLGEEEAFWLRYRRLLAAQKRAKSDHEPLLDAVLLLSQILPRQLCWSIARFLS
jgi:hypothetical protein